jgi:hypothetical protein
MSGHDQYSHHTAERKGEEQVQEELEEEKITKILAHCRKEHQKSYKLQPRGPLVNCQATR